jgi:probable F420-dependent oxidoreductase
MRIGVVYPQVELGGDPEAMRRFGLAAESIGYDHLLCYDHVLGASLQNREPKLYGNYAEQHPFHDPFIMFAHLAALTTRIEFVTGVLVLPQRPTALVAKQSADLDLMSNQRLRLGVGVGWNYVEYLALGQDFATRGKRMDEQIALLRRLWTEPLVEHHGAFDHIDRAAIAPRPRRMIPIWIGGMTEPAFRRAGKLGDGFIFNSGTMEARDRESYIARMRERVAAVDRHLAENERQDVPFGRELQLRHTRTTEETVGMAKVWQDMGGTHVCVHTMGRGFAGVDAHIDYIAESWHHLDSAVK